MFKALIKREIKEFYTKRKIVLIILFINIIFLSFMFFPHFFTVSEKTFLPVIFTTLVPVFIITLFSYIMVTEPIYSDKKKKVIEVLLSIGYSPFKIWLSKIIVMVLIVGIIYYISIFFCAIFVFFKFKEIIFLKFSLIQNLNFLIFAPLFGFSLSAFMGFLLFILKDPRYLFLVLFFGFFLLFYFSKKIFRFINPLKLKEWHLLIFNIFGSLFFWLISYIFLTMRDREKWI